MNERNERIEYLLRRYYDALTTDAEERELREGLRTEHLPDGMRVTQRLLEGLDALAAERFPTGRGIVLRRRLSPLWGAAAAAAIVLLGVFLYTGLRRPYCYIDGEAVYDRKVALQTTDYLKAFSEFNDPAGMVDALLDDEQENK